MKLLDWLAALVFFFEWPVPLFWLVVHGFVGFWRPRMRWGYLAGLLSWPAVGAFLIAFRERLFASEHAPAWAIAAGLALLAVDGWILYRVIRDLGTARLVGKAELDGAGELGAAGIYARVRHPRYTGMMLSVAGACLLAWTRLVWVVAAVWWLLALLATHWEEKELRERFGAAYEEYCRRVPAFLPLRIRPRGV